MNDVQQGGPAVPGASLMAALTDPRRRRVYDLAHEVAPGMPIWPSHVPYQQALYRRHGDVVRPDGLSAASDLLIMSGHTGTHIDAPSHVSRDGCLHGGVQVADVQGTHGFALLGVDEIAPVLTRGLLADIPRLLGVDMLEPGHEVDAEQLAAAVPQVRPGDAILVRTGWARYWDEPDRFVSAGTGSPGPGESAARWLADRGVVLCGGDTLPFECIRPGQTELPVHGVLLVDAGIPIVEALDLEELASDGIGEFLLVLTPLRLRGATGSPVRPLAVVLG